MDKAYVDFARLHQLHTARAFFVARAKSNMQFAVVQAFPVLITTSLVSDQHVQLTGYMSHKRYPELIRQVTYTDPETGKTLDFHSTSTSRFGKKITDRRVLSESSNYWCRWFHRISSHRSIGEKWA
jgi:hypothetical protein